MLLLALLAAAAVSASSGENEAPVYAPPPAWVEAAPLSPPPENSQRATQTVLHDFQYRFHRDGTEEVYRHHADLILKPEGFSQFGTQRLTWRPQFGKLIIHQVLIHRGGQTIDALAGGKQFTVLRREEGLEAAMLDGRLTATLQMEDLRVGDVIETAYTIVSKDPTLAGTNAQMDTVNHAGTTPRVRDRFLWGTSDPIKWRASTTSQPTEKKRPDGWTELVYDRSAVPEIDTPLNAPPRFAMKGIIEISDFKSWGDLSALVGPYFAKAAELKPDSPLKAEARKIASATSDLEQRTLLALKLVQDQTRYFAIAVGAAGLQPAAADETWSRRFGDCKGKTVLLLALLKELGITAEPALVRTTSGDLVPELLPTAGAFNHVIVRATVNGQVYWLDPTRMAEHGGLNELPTPRFRWALPLWSKTAGLEEIKLKPEAEPLVAYESRVDFSQGLDKPGPAEFRMILRDEAAESMRILLARSGLDSTRKAFLNGPAQKQAWLEPESASIEDDPKHNTLVMKAVGKTRGAWLMDEDVGRARFAWPEHSINAPALPPRRGVSKDVPIQQNYPTYGVERIEVVLPNRGEGFDPRGPDGCVTDAYRQICASVKRDGAVVRFERSTRTLAPELPAADALAEQDKIAALLGRKASVLAPRPDQKLAQSGTH